MNFVREIERDAGGDERKTVRSDPAFFMPEGRVLALRGALPHPTSGSRIWLEVVVEAHQVGQLDDREAVFHRGHGPLIGACP